MSERCPKCGNTWVRAKYEKLSEKECLRYVCPCGYSWTTRTLDAPYTPRKQEER